MRANEDACRDYLIILRTSFEAITSQQPLPPPPTNFETNVSRLVNRLNGIKTISEKSSTDSSAMPASCAVTTKLHADLRMRILDHNPLASA